MYNPTLDEVERMVDQLASSEQLKLAARICEKLSEGQEQEQGTEHPVDAKRIAQIDAWLAECDAVAANVNIDVVEELRQVREERADRR